MVIDAPPGYAAHIPKAIAEGSVKPITHIIYSRSHKDQIGGAKARLYIWDQCFAMEQSLRIE